MHALVGHRVLVMHKDLFEGYKAVWGWFPELPIEPCVFPVPPIVTICYNCSLQCLLRPPSCECSHGERRDKQNLHGLLKRLAPLFVL